MNDIDVRITALRVYPVKSCAGIALSESTLADTGLQGDRGWMVVDDHGSFVTQRQLPRMALIRPGVTPGGVVLNAPGLPALPLALDATGPRRRVRVWNDEVDAFDMGDHAAGWFSDFLGQALRLVRFDPAQRRLSSRAWTGDLEAPNAFSDGYPVLVTSQAGLDELNRRLAAAGIPGVTMERFRPNLVLDGLEANGEDHLDEVSFDAPGGIVRLKLVKPCSRCPIPDVDPHTAEVGHAVRDALAAYRADARLQGALTFGMNAVIVEGVGRQLTLGMHGGGTYRWV